MLKASLFAMLVAIVLTWLTTAGVINYQYMTTYFLLLLFFRQEQR